MEWKKVEEWVRQQLGLKWTKRCQPYGIDGIKDNGEYFLEVKKWKGSVDQSTVEKFDSKVRRRVAKRGIIVAEKFGKGARKAQVDLNKQGSNIELLKFRKMVKKRQRLTLEQMNQDWPNEGEQK